MTPPTDPGTAGAEPDRPEPRRPDDPTSPTVETAALATEAARAVAGVIAGQQDLLTHVFVALLAEGHVLLEGAPGVGKTEMLKALSAASGLEFSRIQCTPDLMPADVVGTRVLTETEHGRSFEYQPGPVFANLVLADEINRATPKTQAAMLEAMAERAVTVAGATRPLPRPFLVMATQNPIEMEGTYPLPEAQLDRFLFKVNVPHPPADVLAEILRRTTGARPEPPTPVLDAERLREAIELTRQVPIASHLIDHAVALIRATHPDDPSAPPLVRKYVRFGASPRGAQALVLGAKARALLANRPNASSTDMTWVAPAALRHRLVLGYEAIADQITPDDVLEEVLSAVDPNDLGVRGS